MEVHIKGFKVNMELKTGGMELGVYDNSGNFMGDFIATSTGVIWCNGKV